MRGRAKSSGRCVICESRDHVERNHVGGRNHVAWFTMSFCRDHHAQFHAFLRNAGVDLEYTPDDCERLLRALSALTACEWILKEALREVIRKAQGKRPSKTRKKRG